VIATVSFLVGCAIVAALSIPLIHKAVPPNSTYGFRTRKTLSNEAVWYEANVFAGWALLIAAAIGAALLGAVASGVLPSVVPGVVLFVGPLLIAVVACFIYLARIGGNSQGKAK
jgi:uncharacterized membrane protein